MSYNGEIYINPNNASSAYQVGLITENNELFTKKQNIRDATNLISTFSILEQNKILNKQLEALNEQLRVINEQNENLKLQNEESAKELKKSKRYNTIMLIIAIISTLVAIASLVVTIVLP